MRKYYNAKGKESLRTYSDGSLLCISRNGEYQDAVTLPEDRVIIARDLLETLIKSYDRDEAKDLLDTYSENDLLYLAYNCLQAIEIGRVREKEHKVEQERLEKKALKAFNTHADTNYSLFYAVSTRDHWVKIVKALENNGE